MISDLGDENEDDSELAVERFGLRDINDLGPPEMPGNNDGSFGQDGFAQDELVDDIIVKEPKLSGKPKPGA